MDESSDSVKSTWKNFWKDFSVSDKNFKLSKYRKILLKELKKELSENFGKDNIRILNAGCGIDPIPLYLMNHSNTEFYLLDISKDCLDINKRFFVNKLSKEDLKKINFVEGDILKLEFPDGYFDIIYNTGVLEHFNEREKLKIASEFARTLKKGGILLTLNPSKKSKFYTYMKTYLEKIDEWGYGPEYPITSLENIIKETFKDYEITESNMDFQDSCYFLRRHKNLMIRSAGTILFLLAYIPIFEILFKKIFGGYILLSRVHKF